MNIEFPTKKIELIHQLSTLKNQDPKQLTNFEELRDNPTAHERQTGLLDSTLGGININDIDVLNENIVTTVK